MSGRRRGGSVRGVVTALLALGCCLLSAPDARADLDDLLDTVIGEAVAGVDPGGLPADSGDLDVPGVLDDPLNGLDRVLQGTPGAAPADGTADAPADAGHEGGSGSMPSVPKVSIPSTGSGSGGSGSGGSGSGGSGGSGGARTKANTSAAAPAGAPQPAAVP